MRRSSRCAATPTTRSPASPTTRITACASRSMRWARSAKACYDAIGNMVVTTRFAVRPTLVQYTESAIDAAVAPLRADRNNQITRFAYDAQNRLRFTVDALGSVSESVYDGLGNVSSTIRFAVRPPLTQYTESAINAAVATQRNNPSNQRAALHPRRGRSSPLQRGQRVSAGRRSVPVSGDQTRAERVGPNRQQHLVCDRGGTGCVQRGSDRRCRRRRRPIEGQGLAVRLRRRRPHDLSACKRSQWKQINASTG